MLYFDLQTNKAKKKNPTKNKTKTKREKHTDTTKTDFSTREILWFRPLLSHQGQGPRGVTIKKAKVVRTVSITTSSWYWCIFLRCVMRCKIIIIFLGGAVAQSVERATPGEEVPGLIPAVAARSLLVGSVSV